MSFRLRSWLPGLLICAASLACEQPVREDRTIEWAGDGDQVAFQHGPQGVFVAGKDGQGLVQLFQPTADTLATSSPLWAPDEDRLIFTTAQRQDKPEEPPNRADHEPLPEGDVYYQMPVVYTCWLREGEAEPVELFQARIDHIGYIAANLAVRWHPEGDRILFVRQANEKRVGLWEFDLQTKTSQQAFAQTGEALIFDFSPRGDYLTCLLGSKEEPVWDDGLWVGSLADGEWWHAFQPHGGDRTNFPVAELDSMVERLRAARPVWTADGSRFAHVIAVGNVEKPEDVVHLVSLTDPVSRTGEWLGEIQGLVRDLRWAPDGSKLGLLRGPESGGELHFLEPGQGVTKASIDPPARRFAGWNADGSALAFVSPLEAPYQGPDYWALLLQEVHGARDRVFVGPDDQPQEILSGMRVTFPNWSPTEPKLTIWATFSPPYQSWLGQFLQTSLPWGDPAAILDTQTGELSWMAVNAREKAQVGHYHLLNQDYDGAWRWYTEARESPALEPLPNPENIFAWLQNVSAQAHRDIHFFEWYCLTKLNREDEAQAKLEEFERSFLPPLPPEPTQEELKAWYPELQPGKFVSEMLRDLYCAEVFLSLDAASDGEAFFRDGLETATTDEAKLSKGLLLEQMLLFQGKHAEYVRIVTEVTLPIRLQLWQAPAGTEIEDLQPTRVLPVVEAVARLPVFSARFLAELPQDEVTALVERCAELRPQTPDSLAQAEIDLILHAGYQRLGRDRDREQAATRLQPTLERLGMASPASEMTLSEQIDWLILMFRNTK